tara:strand:+ start:475 stop:1497 length:1023 start_codon:yes stop_codon:yes gene_type:complete
MPEKIFTVHIDVFYGLEFFQQALHNIRNQTYKNLEIIISNNGALPEIQNYIQSQAALDSRIKVIDYKKNIFDFNDPELRTFIICNDALKAATGDFFFYQSYDDLMALDYIEKMVKLFNEDDSCMSAAGLPISIYGDNKIAEDELINRKSNLRPRMMAGHELVLDFVNDGIFFSSPGTIFSFRTEFFRRMGGFHRSVEIAQLFGMVPFGSTGFDESAIFYWRRGDFQLNKILNQQGQAGVKEFYDFLKDFDLYERWLEFDHINAIKVIQYGKKSVCNDAARVFLINIAEMRFAGVLINLRIVFFKRYFWMAIPKIFWRDKRFYIYTFYQSIKNILFGRKDK